MMMPEQKRKIVKARERLMTINRLDALIRSRKEELARIEADRVYLSAIRYDGDRVQSSVTDSGSPVSYRVADLTREVQRKILKLTQRRNQIILELEQLPRGEHIELLTRRYIQYQRFEEIAVAMNYSYSRVKHLHIEALEQFAEVLGID